MFEIRCHKIFHNFKLLLISQLWTFKFCLCPKKSVSPCENDISPLTFVSYFISVKILRYINTIEYNMLVYCLVIPLSIFSSFQSTYPFNGRTSSGRRFNRLFIEYGKTSFTILRIESVSIFLREATIMDVHVFFISIQKSKNRLRDA